MDEKKSIKKNEPQYILLNSKKNFETLLKEIEKKGFCAIDTETNSLNVSLSDLRGSHSIGQLSDIVLGLERNGQADCVVERHTTYARVIKNRVSGLTGQATKLYYDLGTGRITELEEL